MFMVSANSSTKYNNEHEMPPEEEEEDDDHVVQPVTPQGRPVPPRLRMRQTSFSETPLGLQILHNYRQVRSVRTRACLFN